jgi:hypothetical protein
LQPADYRRVTTALRDSGMIPTVPALEQFATVCP